MEVEAKKRQDRPKKATKRGKRRNKRVTPTIDLTMSGARGPWPGGRGDTTKGPKTGDPTRQWAKGPANYNYNNNNNYNYYNN